MTVLEFVKEYSIKNAKHSLSLNFKGWIRERFEIALKFWEKADLETVRKEIGTGKIDKGFLDLEYSKYEIKKGRMGKSYFEFDNGVKFFPNARYGYYATKD